MSSSRVVGPTGKGVRFVVEVHSVDANHKATRQVVRFATTIRTAIGALIDVMLQWQASEGAIPPGTKVVIRDTRDGGTFLYAHYLGFSANLMTKGV